LGDCWPSPSFGEITVSCSRGSGKWLVYPEVDRCGWFDPATARAKLNPAQAELLDRLEASLRSPA